jgi:hypothetical protein
MNRIIRQPKPCYKQTFKSHQSPKKQTPYLTPIKNNQKSQAGSLEGNNGGSVSFEDNNHGSDNTYAYYQKMIEGEQSYKRN